MMRFLEVRLHLFRNSICVFFILIKAKYECFILYHSFCLHLDDTVNWYSSSEEEEGSSVKSILKTLQKQTETLRSQQQPSTELSTPTDRSQTVLFLPIADS